MSPFADHPRARWAVPAGAVVLIAAGSLLASRTASADSGLPSRSAAQLLVDVQQSATRQLSGTVVQTANLGLPDIPGLTGQASGSPAAKAGAANLSSIVSGTHTWRVWLGGPTQARVALVGGSGESDIIRNGDDVWVWSSADKSAVHEKLTAQHRAGVPSAPTDLPKTPDEAAQKALAAIDPTTQVTTAGTAVVAGRQAYELVLQPRTKDTRVAQVRIAVDAEKYVPLRVQVYSTKVANPAVEVGFTSIDFAAPDARQFQFTPPPGTTVTESGGPPAGTSRPTTKPAEPKVVGSGWTSVVVATLPSRAAGASQDQQLESLLGSVPKVSGDWGSGRLVDGTLFSAVLTDDGRVAVGAVGPDLLYAALKSS
ncbi:MAG TPA: sigma-E factor regulatory protein RseB domain-containing protein [Lapillicoccus sp.]